MVWARRTRITLLVTLLLLAATLSWLASHPSLYAGQVGRLLTTNLLHEAGATFSCRDLEGNPLSRMVFRDVTMTREGEDGSFLYLTADSLVVGYDVTDVFSRRTRLREFVAGGVDVLLRQGNAAVEGRDRGGSGAGSLPSDVRVERLGLIDIDMRITRADGSVVEEFRGLNLELAAESAGDGVDALLTRCELEWVTQDVRLHRARGRVRLEHPRYSFTSMHVETDSIQGRADLFMLVGDGLDSLRVEGLATSFHLNELLRAIGKDGDGPRLVASGDAVVTRDRRDVLRIEASGSGFLEDAPIRGDEFIGVLRDDVLYFEHIRGQYRSAEGVVSGRVGIESDPPLLELEGDVVGVDASDPWADGQDLGWPTSDLAGRVRLQLALGDSIDLRLELDELRGEAATLPVESGRAVSTWSEARGFRLHEATVQSMGGARIHAEGTIQPDDSVELRVGAVVDSLAPWAREVLLPITGEVGNVSGVIRGTLDSLVLEGGGFVERAGSLGLELTDAEIDLRIPRLLTRPGDVELDIRAAEHSILSRSNGSFAVSLTRNEPVIDVDELLLVREPGRLRARGRVRELGDERFAIELDSMGTDWEQDRWHLADGGRMEVADGYFHTGGMVFESDAGRVAIRGGVRPPARLGLVLDLEGADLDLLDRLDLVEGIDGKLDGRLEFTGSIDSTGIAVDATVDSLVVAGRRVDSGRLVARATGGHVELDALEFDSATGAAYAEGTIDFDRPDWLRYMSGGAGAAEEVWSGAMLEVDVRPRELDVAYWADPKSPSGEFGFVTAELGMRGSTRQPSARGTVDVLNFPAPPFHFPELSGYVVLDSSGLSLTRGRLDIGGPEATVQARLPLRVSFTGPAEFLPREGVRVEILTPEDFDLSGLTAIWPDLRRTSGRGTFYFVAEGDPEAPELSGRVEIRDGELQLRGWSEWLRELEVDGHFTGQRLVFDRIEAREGAKGRVRATGSVDFAGLLPDDFALDIDAERVLVSSVPGLKAIGSGNDLQLRLERPSPGVPRVPSISGSLDVDKAVYTGSFESDPADDAALGPNAAPPWMARLRIRLRDQIRISNALTELRVAGDVDFARDTEGTSIRGQVTIPSGRILIFGTNFRITQGELDFSRRPLEPEVNIAAVTEIPIYDQVGGTARSLEEITLQMTGTFAEPELRFDSKSGYDDASIMRLIAGFQPTPTTDQDAAGTIGMRAGFNVLERALSQEMTGIDTVEIETTETVGTDDLGSTRIAFGKYLSDSVYLRYAQGFTAGERDILLEYQMSLRTLISAEIKSRINQTGTEDEFNIDFKWRFRY
jgi:hypothetical protein